MSRLIDADALKDELELADFETDSRMFGGQTVLFEDSVFKIVDSAPTISPDDVRGVGEWIETAMPSGWYDVTCAECSVCGEDFMLGDYCMDDVRDLFHYCPNCGTRMMEVSEDA